MRGVRVNNNKNAKKLETREIIPRITDEGVMLTIVGGNGEQVLLLPFADAEKLGRQLIIYGRTGLIQHELLMKKLAQLEYEINRVKEKISDVEKALDDFKVLINTITEKVDLLWGNLKNVKYREENRETEEQEIT